MITRFIFATALIALSAHAQTANVELRRPTYYDNRVVHRGVIRVTDTAVNFLGGYTETGAYISDNSTNYFTDLNVSPGGYITAGLGDVFILSGSFNNNSSQNTSWNTIGAELNFRVGASPHLCALPGANLGASYFGYVDNFAWAILHLQSGQSLTLTEGNATPGAAFYVTRVTLDDGLAQIGQITGNGTSIYYDPTDAGNSYLLNGAPGGIYTLAGGGVLAPALANLKVESIAHPHSQHVLLNCRGVPNRKNRIEASPDLSPGSFVTIATIAVDGTGAFTFEDPNAGSFSKRFYRVAFP